MDADGGNQQPLTDLVSSSDPVWSPDSARIAFTSQNYDRYYSELFVVDANGANLATTHRRLQGLQPGLVTRRMTGRFRIRGAKTGKPTAAGTREAH